VTLGYGAIINYPKMMSGDLFSTRCPPGFLDVPVVIRCSDGHGVVHSGGCFKHCQADWFWDPAATKKEDPNSWSVQHYEIMHDTSAVRECPKYFDGYITLSCWSGKVTMTKGHCSKNCRPGRVWIRPGVVVRNREMLSGFMASQIPCPPSFDGNMRLACNEGEVSLGSGGCNQTCSPGVRKTAPYGELGDNKEAEIACPDTGTIMIKCNDGFITVLGGECFKGCPPCTVIDANGTRIEYPYIRYNESIGGACSGLAKGVVTLRCNNTVVTQTPAPGERCLRFCRSKPVFTPDGSIIFPPDTQHGNQVTVRCPNGLLGLVTVTCYDTEFSVVDGVCGNMNCPESAVSSNGAYLSHFSINNGWQAGPTVCPGPYEGVATFWCRNGTTTVDEVTTQLPVSPDDYAAAAIGNESSEDARFILCGCCHPLGVPDEAGPVKGRDTGIYIWAAALGGGLSIVLAAFSGWYFLPRKKTSRVFPEKSPKPEDPRPIHETSLEKVLDEFTQKLKNNPALAQQALERNYKLKALPPDEQRLAIENMKQNPDAAKEFFTRRSVQYLMAVQASAASPPRSATPLSPSSRVQTPKGQQPPQLALYNQESPEDFYDLRQLANTPQQEAVVVDVDPLTPERGVPGEVQAAPPEDGQHHRYSMEK
jgi:hypothetical protein